MRVDAILADSHGGINASSGTRHLGTEKLMRTLRIIPSERLYLNISTAEWRSFIMRDKENHLHHYSSSCYQRRMGVHILLAASYLLAAWFVSPIAIGGELPQIEVIMDYIKSLYL